MKREIALKLLDEVRESYNMIADDFSRTRQVVWEEFKSLVQHTEPGVKILDLGCGNGRLVEFFRGKLIEYTGLDSSGKLVEIARIRYPMLDFRVFDGLKIPFEDNYFDAIYCIAVLHHIPGNQLRREFLQEANRVLRPGGRLVLSTWRLWGKVSFWRLLLKFTVKKIVGKSELDFFDIMETWGKISERYLRNLRRGELKRLVKKAGFKIEKLFLLKRGRNKNLVVIASKANHE